MREFIQILRILRITAGARFATLVRFGTQGIRKIGKISFWLDPHGLVLFNAQIEKGLKD